MSPTGENGQTWSQPSSLGGADTELLGVSRRILLLSTKALSRTDFWKEVIVALLEFTRCDAVELRVSIRDRYHRFEGYQEPGSSVVFDSLPVLIVEEGKSVPPCFTGSRWEWFCEEVASRRVDRSLSIFTQNGSFWTGDIFGTLAEYAPTEAPRPANADFVEDPYQSIAIIPFKVADGPVALMLLKHRSKNRFNREQIAYYEAAAQTLGVAVSERRSHAALRERVKELTCLYGIAKLVERPELSLNEALQRIVELLPPGWQFPEVTHARIRTEGIVFETPGFVEGPHVQAADLIVNGRWAGVVEVVYGVKKPELDEGPFLREERNLIDAVARQVALFIERRLAAEEKARLRDQLLHADRLATIGQLAAGVAHELNEPLASVLGFAQLTMKDPVLSEQAAADIEKIIKASLHAREVVKKLMLFARRMPPKKTRVDLNVVVDEGLYFLSARCAKQGIELVRVLSRDLRQITADPAQLTQIVVNLVVNAIQAMPSGGRLTVATYNNVDSVFLTVEDTGMGMDRETLDNVFVPFFTTKDVTEGTGLGLSVVHGIVTSHGGTVKVESVPGTGSRFEVRLPVRSRTEAEEDG